MGWNHPRWQYTSGIIYCHLEDYMPPTTHLLGETETTIDPCEFFRPGDSSRDLLTSPSWRSRFTLEKVTFSPSRKGHGLNHLGVCIFFPSRILTALVVRLVHKPLLRCSAQRTTDIWRFGKLKNVTSGSRYIVKFWMYHMYFDAFLWYIRISNLFAQAISPLYFK